MHSNYGMNFTTEKYSHQLGVNIVKLVQRLGDKLGTIGVHHVELMKIEEGGG